MADWQEKLDEYVAQHSEDYARRQVDFLGFIGQDDQVTALKCHYLC